MTCPPLPGRCGALIAAIGFGLIFAAGAAAQPMTGPIDLGGPIKTGPIQLNPSQPAPPPPTRAPAARPPVPSKALDIKAFYGKFSGTGFADASEADYFGMSQRDLDVQIEAAADGGFTLAWTTVLREGGDPKTPNVRRRSVSMTFVPGPRPGLFHATDNGDPLAGGMLTWAHVTGNTLTVSQFTVQANGRRVSQSYARTLSGGGMDLVYIRNVDGERLRRVRGKLIKIAN